MLEVEEPLTKEGAGSVVAPWKLGLDKDALFDDIAGNGLSWNEATEKLQACLSRDTGNNLRFGGDGCLYAPGGDTPMPDVCARPIESLPPAPGVVGAKSLAGLHNPYSSPYGVDYCLTHGLDIIHFQVATDAEDVGVVSDYWDDKITGGRTSLYIGQDIRQLPTSTVQSVYNYAGEVNDPNSYQRPEPDEPEGREDRRGGWYGWLAQRYHQPLAEDFLRKIDAKSVALLACTPEPGNSYGTEATHIRGAIRAVLQQCAQPWAMIGVSSIANATTVLGAGITPVLGDTWPQVLDSWGETTLPFPVAEVTGAGVEWMALSDHYADSVFSAYQAAGINVLMIGNSRQFQAARVADLGIRGALVLDPVYYKQFRDGYGYRSATDPWEHRRMSTGQLTYRTDQQDVISDGGYVRGRTERAEQGLIIPAGFGEGIGRPSILVWESPITDPETYTITWDMKWNTLAQASANTAKMGLLVGAGTDEDPYDWPDDPELNPRGYPHGQNLLYRVFQRQNGQLGIAKWATRTGPIEYLALASSPAIAGGVWNSYTLRVTPTQLTFTRTLSGGEAFSVVAADSQHRGPYFFIEKEESFEGEPANPFEGKFRNVTYTAG
ncbi:hypothetical protein [Streptomyces olivaceus]|uniref:hypothetical protein n=1 Tax=Streptomyces olivaceus TaxID=47716 RepID=UPI0024923D5A|nr:hypothetical protein [Streptomyces olivaceus]